MYEIEIVLPASKLKGEECYVWNIINIFDVLHNDTHAQERL